MSGSKGHDDNEVSNRGGTRPVPLPGGGVLAAGTPNGSATTTRGRMRRRVIGIALTLSMLAAMGTTAVVIWSSRQSAPATNTSQPANATTTAEPTTTHASSDDTATARDLDINAATPDRDGKSSPVIVTVTPKAKDTAKDPKTVGSRAAASDTVTVLADAPDHRSASGSVKAAAGDTITVASVNADGAVSRATHVVTKDDLAKATDDTDTTKADASTTGTSKDTTSKTTSGNDSKDTGSKADGTTTPKDTTSTPKDTTSTDKAASTDTSKTNPKDTSKDASGSKDDKDTGSTTDGKDDTSKDDAGDALDLDAPKDPDVTADQLRAFLDALDKAHKAGKVTDGQTRSAAEAAARNPKADDAVKRAASGIVDALGKADGKKNDDKKDDGKADAGGKADGGTPAPSRPTSTNGGTNGQTTTPAPTPSKPTGNGSNGNGNGGANKPRTWVETRPAWTEIVVDKPEWTEKVKVRDAWDETKLVVRIRIYDGMGGEWYFDSLSEAEAFAKAETLKGHGVAMQDMSQYKTIHHDAEYKTVVHPAITHTVNHPAEGYWK